MARPSSTKKVSRAAQTGGGRTTRGSQSLLYWGVIALVVILGVAGVAVSRDQRLDALEPGSDVAPRAGQDHWHTAYGIYICDQFIDPITDQRDPEGIHTHADGVIHVHPLVRRAAGRNARLSKFFDAVRLDLSDTEIEVPGGETYSEGDDECDGEPGVMQLKVKGEEKVITTNIEDFVFDQDRQVITIAFAPKDADIPLPPSEATLDNLSDVAPTSTTAPAGADTSTTVAGGETSDTTDTTAAPPADASTTTAP